MEFRKRRYLRRQVRARIEEYPLRAVPRDGDRALRPRLGAQRPGPESAAIGAVAIPLRKATPRGGAEHMDPHKWPGLGLRILRGRFHYRAIRDANLAGLRERGAVAVDFRITADFDEFRRFPIVHEHLPRRNSIRDGFPLEQPKLLGARLMEGVIRRRSRRRRSRIEDSGR